MCGTTTTITSYTAGDTLYAESATKLNKLAIGGAGQVLGIASGIPAWSGHLQFIGSRISRTDSTHIALGVGVIPLKIGSNWVLKPVTAAVSVDTTGLSSSTLYYVYAFDSSGTLTLELSATGHSTDTTWGVEIKTGDATRTLVGMVRTNGSTQFVDTAAQRFVVSYFNRKSVAALNRLSTADVTTTSTSFVEMSTTLLRAEFLTWGDEAIMATAVGAASAATNNGFSAIGIDNTTPVSTEFMPVGVTAQRTLDHSSVQSEGYHFVTVLGRIVTSGTITMFGSTSLASEAQAVMTVQVVVRG